MLPAGGNQNAADEEVEGATANKGEHETCVARYLRWDLEFCRKGAKTLGATRIRRWRVGSEVPKRAVPESIDG